jgi:hypothetical protein
MVKKQKETKGSMVHEVLFIAIIFRLLHINNMVTLHLGILPGSAMNSPFTSPALQGLPCARWPRDLASLVCGKSTCS